MATIHYQFADGHFEDIEVTDEFKREYEFLAVQERAHYWKIKKQKQRAGLAVKYDLSLDRLCENGQEPTAFANSPLDEVIEREERAEYYRKLLRPLTDKQREVYVMHHIKGYSKVRIAAILHIDESSVRERLYWAQKKNIALFFEIPPILMLFCPAV